MMMEYNFYFDEAFHDRKITISSNGEVNTMKPNALDNYIGVFWGCKATDLGRNVALLNDFEQKYRNIYSISNEGELKSTIIPMKQYVCGIHSMNANAKLFIHDLFCLIHNMKPIIQINAVSKIEHLLNIIFGHVRFPYWVDQRSFIYSLTKMILVYKPISLLELMFSEETTVSVLFAELKYTLRTICKESEGEGRKQKEYESFKEISIILDSIVDDLNIQEKYQFDYKPNFHGLTELLKELNIDPRSCKIVIDNENKTFETAKQFKFRKVKQSDSMNLIQLHLSDWLSGFIGRMMYSLSADLQQSEPIFSKDGFNAGENYLEKRLLSEKWFGLSEEEFNLYILIYETLIVEQEHYWTTLTLSYCDQVVLFYAFLRHIASYKNYETFMQISSKMHSEYYNSRCLDEMQRQYSKMNYKAWS